MRFNKPLTPLENYLTDKKTVELIGKHRRSALGKEADVSSRIE